MSGLGQQDGVTPPSPDALKKRANVTRAIHADDYLNSATDVAPPLHVSSTFRYASDPEHLRPVSQWEVFKHVNQTPTDSHIYSRLSAPTTTRLEAILSSLMGGRAITYSSGLSAFHALMVLLNPKRIAIGEGYHGVHGVIGIHQKLSGLQKVDLHASDEEWDVQGLGTGDVVHVETPLNPTGEAYDLSAYARRAHARGAFLTVDATFGPPPLQDPFASGADIVMHSGTKYLGGHSDMLCGVLVVNRDDWWWQLYRERLLLGAVMGNMEGWLGLRSIRTLELRVRRQSETATELVRRLDRALTNVVDAVDAANHGTAEYINTPHRGLEKDHGQVARSTIEKVTHASLQLKYNSHAESWLPRQMPNGFGPVFSLWLKSPAMARAFPSKLELFHHATSLGGVESLIEWRSMTDENIDARVLRVSVGIEDVDDLWIDMMNGLQSLLTLSDSSVGSIERFRERSPR